jgi:acyl-CoA thioesterase
MSFRDTVDKAGSFKALLDNLRASGANVEKQVQQAFENDRIFGYIGFTVDKVEPGSVRLSFPLSENATRWGGMVHGGVVMTALDNACGLAVMTVNPGREQVTVELKVNFLEQLTNGPFRVHGKVIRSGRTTIVAEGEIRDSKDVLCAKGIGTWLVLNNIG